MVLEREAVRRRPLLQHTPAAPAVEHHGDPTEHQLISVRGFETALVLALRPALGGEAVGRTADDHPSLRALCHPGISRALTAVHGRYSEQWTVDLPAREARMSRTAFTAVFRELVGESPGRHLTARRMREGARLLRETDQALSVIPGRGTIRPRPPRHAAMPQCRNAGPSVVVEAGLVRLLGHPRRRCS